MGKRAAERQLADNEAMAYAKYLRTSPQKLNLIAQSIRGLGDDQPVDVEIVVVLGVGDRRLQNLAHVAGNTPARKLKLGQRPVVAEASVGRTLVMKRWKARARGRVGRIQKPFSNLRLVLREREEID